MQKKTSDKFQHPFMMKKKKTLNKLLLRGNALEVTKAICDQPTDNIFNTENFSSKIRSKTRGPILTAFIQYSTESPSQSN